MMQKGQEDLSLDFVPNLLKDQVMPPLPILDLGYTANQKYGSHSALNMFDEFSMTNPAP